MKLGMMDSEGEETGQRNMYDLWSFGIPKDVLDTIVFEHGGDPRLLNLQLKGVLAGVCDPARLLGRSGVISGPTSSGKTLLAELRLLVRYFESRKESGSVGNIAEGRTKTIYLVPTRAIGLEKLGYFESLYGQFGIKVLYSDGDARNHDGDILRGKFDLAIVVNEKLKFFMLHNPHFLRLASEVVVDEIGLLSDRSRGPGLEVTLAGLLLSPYKPTILALTTSLRDAGPLVALLDGFLLEEETRPVDIRAGTWSRSDGQFKSWSCNTLEAYPPETMDLGYPSDKDRTLKKLLLRYRGSIMFALPTKDMVRRYASRLYELADADAEVRDLLAGQTDSGLIDQRMKGLEATRSKEALLKYMRVGIGLHHADLTSEEKKEVECAFRNGEVPVVFCTSTLARGVNLPAQSVVFLDWGDAFVTRDRISPCYQQLAQEFGSWVGRAGRLGKCTRAAPEAIYVAQTGSERRWIDKLVCMGKAELSTHLGDNGLGMEDIIVSAAAWLRSSACCTVKSEAGEAPAGVFGLLDLERLFTRTLSVRGELSKSQITNKIINALVRLTNRQGGQPFVQLRLAISRAPQLTGSRGDSDLVLNAASLPGFVACLEELKNVSTQAAETVACLERVLVDSIDRRCRSMTLHELGRVLHGHDVHEDIDRLMAVLGRLYSGYPSMTLDAVQHLLDADPRLASVGGLHREISALRERLGDLVRYEFTHLCDENRPRARLMVNCSLPFRNIFELRSLMGSEDVLKFFLLRQPSVSPDKCMVPSYLKCVNEGERIGFRLTPLGKICCAHGISTSTCDELYSWTRSMASQGRRRELEVAEVLDRLLETTDGKKIGLLHTNLTTSAVADVTKIPVGNRTATKALSAGRNRAVTVLAMMEWAKGTPSLEIENKCGLCAGSLHEVSRQLSRLARALGDVSAEVLRESPEDNETDTGPAINNGMVRIPQDLKELADILLHGVPVEALPIAFLGVEGLSRGWVTSLWHGLQNADGDEGLPIIEQLQQAGEDRLKEMLPTRGLIQRLKDKLASKTKDLLAANLVARAEFLVGYYLLPQVVNAQLNRGKRHYGAHARNMAVRITTSDERHVVLRRKGEAGCTIRIETEQELVDWVKRGAVDFYGEIGEEFGVLNAAGHGESKAEEPRYVTDRFFVDLDPQNGYPMNKLKAAAERIHALLSHLPQVETTKMYWSGGKGFHIVGMFKETVYLEVQAAKRRLGRLLTSGGICNDSDTFLGEDAANIDPYLIVDLASMMRRGLYRNEFGIHAISGGCCIEVEINKLASFDPAREATPEAVKDRLLDQLTQEQRSHYSCKVARALGDQPL